MKAIINGKRYDTEAPKTVCIAVWTHSYSSDFEFTHEELHRTGKGAFFLAGRGGPRSSYAERIGNSGGWSGSSRITPLSADEALSWLESHDLTDAIEAVFGDSIEDA